MSRRFLAQLPEPDRTSRQQSSVRDVRVSNQFYYCERRIGRRNAVGWRFTYCFDNGVRLTVKDVNCAKMVQDMAMVFGVYKSQIEMWG